MTWIPEAGPGDCRCGKEGCDLAVLARVNATGRRPKLCPKHSAKRSAITEAEYQDGQASVLRLDGEITPPTIMRQLARVPGMGVGGSTFWANVEIAADLAAQLPHEVIAERRGATPALIEALDRATSEDPTSILGQIRAGERDGVGRASVIACSEALAMAMRVMEQLQPSQVAFLYGQMVHGVKSLAPQQVVATVQIQLPTTEDG